MLGNAALRLGSEEIQEECVWVNGREGSASDQAVFKVASGKPCEAGFPACATDTHALTNR